MTLPISDVIVCAYASLCLRRISAKCNRYPARSLAASFDQERNSARALSTFFWTSFAVAMRYDASGLPLAGVGTLDMRRPPGVFRTRVFSDGAARPSPLGGLP